MNTMEMKFVDLIYHQPLVSKAKLFIFFTLYIIYYVYYRLIKCLLKMTAVHSCGSSANHCFKI